MALVLWKFNFQQEQGDEVLTSNIGHTQVRPPFILTSTWVKMI